MSELLKWDEKMEKEFVDHDTDIVEATIAVSIFATLSEGIYQFDYPQQICRAGYLAARQRDAGREEQEQKVCNGIYRLDTYECERDSEFGPVVVHLSDTIYCPRCGHRIEVKERT